MTREEAKNWLHKLYARADITDEYGDMEDMQPYEEAINMAISALSAEGDMISRQAVDDVIAEIKSWYWQADRQALAKDPCVVDAMVDLFIRTIYKHIGKAEREVSE